MAPELFDAWENETVPAKTLASDCYAFGQAIVEVRRVRRPAFLIHVMTTNASNESYSLVKSRGSSTLKKI